MNFGELIGAVRWASENNLGVEIAGPTHLVANLVAQPRRYLLHLVNYNATAAALAKPIPVRLQIPAGETVAKVTLLSPDAPAAHSLKYEVAAGKVRFQVPPLAVYAMVVVQYGDSSVARR